MRVKADVVFLQKEKKKRNGLNRLAAVPETAAVSQRTARRDPGLISASVGSQLGHTEEVTSAPTVPPVRSIKGHNHPGRIQPTTGRLSFPCPAHPQKEEHDLKIQQHSKGLTPDKVFLKMYPCSRWNLDHILEKIPKIVSTILFILDLMRFQHAWSFSDHEWE